MPGPKVRSDYGKPPFNLQRLQVAEPSLLKLDNHLGKAHVKGAAFTQLGFYPQFSFDILNGPFDDRKPDPRCPRIRVRCAAV